MLENLFPMLVQRIAGTEAEPHTQPDMRYQTPLVFASGRVLWIAVLFVV